jgi:hypothetical protein
MAPDFDTFGSDPCFRRQQDRVILADEQASAWPQQVRDYAAPTADVGQPRQRADARIHQAELARAQGVGRSVHLGLDERGVGPCLGREPLRGLDGLPGEVQAGHRRAQSGQGDRVSPDVAL